jgi:amidohydrolase
VDVEEAKRRLGEEVERRADLLVDASRRIHAHPELAYDETYAHDLLTRALEDEGLAVRRGAYGVPTAFEACAGTDGPTVAVLCEYDALPGIGHACGHNIIAAAGLGAGLAAACLARELGGRVRILGTPAEEGGGGKILLANAGALEGVDAAMMVHPAADDLRSMDAIAIQQLRVTYHGKAAHAAAAPWQGVNALDAAVIGYTDVAALRQHIRPDERVHGIFAEAGDQPNIVPSRAATYWYIRAADLDRLEELKPRVLAALAAGAVATGATMEHEWQDRPYADLRTNGPLADLYAANAERLGRTVLDPADPGVTPVVGSTDMGNVSYLVPSIHPMIAVAPTGISIHTPAFAEHAGTEPGDRAVLDGARAMAWTIADLWLDPDALDGVRRAFSGAPR